MASEKSREPGTSLRPRSPFAEQRPVGALWQMERGADIDGSKRPTPAQDDAGRMPPPPPTTTTARKLWVLWSALLLSLPIVDATNPRVLPKPPRIVNATNTSLTLEVDVECPPNCNVSESLTWEVKVDWTQGNQRTRIFDNQNTTVSIGELIPGKRYDIRALLQLKDENTPYRGEDVPVVSAYTCNKTIPPVTNLTVAEAGTSHFILNWLPGTGTCVSAQYVTHTTPSGDDPDEPSCPPTDFGSRHREHYCNTTGDGQECTARIDDVKAGTFYRLTVFAVWQTYCSPPSFVYATAEKKYPMGMSAGALAALVGVLLAVCAATPCIIVALRRRRAARATSDCTVGYSKRYPKATKGRMFDLDGYLLMEPDIELLSYEKL